VRRRRDRAPHRLACRLGERLIEPHIEVHRALRDPKIRGELLTRLDIEASPHVAAEDIELFNRLRRATPPQPPWTIRRHRDQPVTGIERLNERREEFRTRGPRGRHDRHRAVGALRPTKRKKSSAPLFEKRMHPKATPVLKQHQEGRISSPRAHTDFGDTAPREREEDPFSELSIFQASTPNIT
jgi:hypothetical protein